MGQAGCATAQADRKARRNKATIAREQFREQALAAARATNANLPVLAKQSFRPPADQRAALP